MSKEEVLNILKGEVGTALDPALAAPVLSVLRTLGARSLSYSRRRISESIGPIRFRNGVVSWRERGTTQIVICYGGQGQERGPPPGPPAMEKARGDTGFLHPKMEEKRYGHSPADRLELSPGLFRRAVSGQT